MESNTIYFPGCFQIVGGSIDKLMRASFIITGKRVENPKIAKYGYVIDDPDTASTGIFGKTGTITEGRGAFIQPVKNATVLVKKDGFIYDKVKTDDLGKYTIFVPSGTYDIEINSQAFNRNIKNYEIKDGVTIAYANFSQGEILQRQHDTVMFLYDNGMGGYNNYKDSLINGEILNYKDEPVKDAEIIISNGNQLAVYFKTSEDGMYSFALPWGKYYDVRIKLPGQHVKVARNVFFGGKRFIGSVLEELSKG